MTATTQQKALMALSRIKNDLSLPNFNVALLEEGEPTDLDFKLIVKALLEPPIEYAVRYRYPKDSTITRYNHYGSFDDALDLARDWAMGASDRTVVRRRQAGDWEEIS